jgi:hypothetical protein
LCKRRDQILRRCSGELRFEETKIIRDGVKVASGFVIWRNVNERASNMRKVMPEYDCPTL